MEIACLVLLRKRKSTSEDEEVHIGKSSAGWTFTFHATDTIRSEKDWREETRKGQIFDSYGEEISYADFWAKVDEKKNEPNNHAAISKEGGSFLDEEGNSMSPYEFS